jgi:probable phosphoglycerate mutase
MTTTNLWLARHGETVWTVEDRFNGWADTRLTERGRMQAKRLAEWLKDEPIKAAYCSPLSRCAETAELAAEPHQLTSVVDPALKELDYGAWDGLARPDIVAQYPAEWTAWVDDPARQSAPSGESGYDTLARVKLVVTRIIEAHAGETVLVVAHKAVNRLLLCHILGVPPRDYRRRIGQLPCALNCIRWIDGEPLVTLMNSTAHYREKRW